MVASYLRRFLLLAVLLIVAWSFFDVGRRTVKRWNDRAARPVELTVMHWGGPAEDKIVRDLVERFMAEHPKVRVTRINTGDAGQLRTKLKTMMSAGQPPDLFYLPPDLLPELAQMGLLKDVSEKFGREPEAWRGDFYPILLDAFRYDRPTGTTGRGALYALPKDFTTAVFYINVDLFEKAGVDWRDIQKNGWSWDRFEAEMKKIRALNGTPGYEGREIFGTLLQIWPDTLRHVLWTFDADFFPLAENGLPDFTRSALDSPGAQRGLDLIARLRLRDRTAFNASGIAKDGGQEFLIGNIGCTGPIGRWQVPTYKSIESFRWDVVPSPHGTSKASQIFYTGWTMAAKSAEPDAAWDLMKFLCGREGQVQQARAGLAIPSLQSVAQSDDFLRPPAPSDGAEKPIPPHNAQAFLDAIPAARLQQLPREQEWGRILEEHVNRAIVTGQQSPADAAANLQKAWSTELNSPLRKQQWQPMPWTPIVLVTLGIMATLVALLWWKSRREKLGPLDRATERTGFLFIAPWLIGFACLTLGPMVLSLLLSFTRWTGLNTLGGAEYVGAANYTQLVTADHEIFVQSLKVTAYFVILGVPLSQLAALGIALLMNSNVRGIAIFRTIYFVPSVVSGVVLGVLWLQLFNNEYGIINKLLAPIFNLWGSMPPNWFGVNTKVSPPVNDAAVWAIPGFVIMGLWGVGGGMIIYLAGLKGIPASLYEAARIDGAGPARRFWNITLPMLSPLLFYNLVMGIIGSFQVFTQAYTMTGAGPDNATLFYVLQLYRQAFEFHNMGYASAMAWVLFVIVLLLTLLVFRSSKNLVYYEGLR
jgi:multiple sugar transport system permease protein